MLRAAPAPRPARAAPEAGGGRRGGRRGGAREEGPQARGGREGGPGRRRGGGLGPPFLPAATGEARSVPTPGDATKVLCVGPSARSAPPPAPDGPGS